MGKLFTLSEIQDEGQVDTLQTEHRDQREGPFLIPRCPEESTDNQVRRTCSPALLYLASFFLLKKVFRENNSLPLFPISSPEKGAAHQSTRRQEAREGTGFGGGMGRSASCVLCCFPGENTALTRDFALSLFLCPCLEREDGIYSQTH